MSKVRTDEEPPEPLTATVAEYDDRPDVCTLHPVDPGENATTAWISAEEGSYLPLLGMR